MRLAMLGNQVVSYIKDNSASLVATAATAGGWTAAAVAGGKGAVVGVCLVGGGMFATLVAHEALKGVAKVGFSAIKGMREGILRATTGHPEPRPEIRGGPVHREASTGNPPM